MGLALLALLYLGFIIGTLACGMGLYFLFLKIRGVHKLGDVPGIGEFGTLQAGSTLVMIGAYCFYYSLVTYLPLQNGAVLQSRVDKLVVDTSRDLRKEYNDVRNAHPDPDRSAAVRARKLPGALPAAHRRAERARVLLQRGNATAGRQA